MTTALQYDAPRTLRSDVSTAIRRFQLLTELPTNDETSGNILSISLYLTRSIPNLDLKRSIDIAAHLRCIHNIIDGKTLCRKISRFDIDEYSTGLTRSDMEYLHNQLRYDYRELYNSM